MSSTMEIDPDYPACSRCNAKRVEVCCTTCDVLLCALCQLLHHKTHDFKIIKEWIKDVLSIIKIDRVEILEINKCLNNVLYETEMKLNNMRTLKIKLHKEIENQFAVLQEELKKRMAKLKISVDDAVADFTYKFMNDKILINNIKEHNVYLLDFSERLLQQNNVYVIVKSSTKIINELHTAGQNSLRMNKMIEYAPLMVSFDYKISFDRCILSIQTVGRILSTYYKYFPGGLKQELSNDNMLTFE